LASFVLEGGKVEASRQQEFRRNEKLEVLLREINDLLGPVEEAIAERYRMPRYPVVFVVGVPRSGTTLITQWLAKTGRFAYPTNLLSRFYAAPAVGAKIQQLLTAPEYNFRDELLDLAESSSFQSELGKTRGALEPNEFWYFWRRFLPNTELRYLDEQELLQIEKDKFVAELAAIEDVFDKPLAMKGMILQLHIDFLSRSLQKVLFLFVRRHPFYNIQSLLESRVRFFGDRSVWYSSKPQEYEWLKDLEPIEQVSGQVYFTACAIEEGLSRIDPSRQLTIDYEQFCAEPEQVFDQVVERLSQQGYAMDGNYVGPGQFQHTNQVRLSAEDCEKTLSSYGRFSGVEVRL
jgi:hypothetical protein